MNETSGAVLVNMIRQNETRYGLVLEEIEQVMSCHLLIVSVKAASVVGESEPGKVTGGFPIGEQKVTIHTFLSALGMSPFTKFLEGWVLDIVLK